jgi:hypothetical protein
MDFQRQLDEVKSGHITQDAIDFLKYRTFTQILDAKTTLAADALWAYACFLNGMGVTSDNYPLYIEVLASNNRFAIDALLADHEPESFLDCVAPNPYIVRTCFETFQQIRSNEIYEKSLRVFLGVLLKVYASPEEGFQLFPVTIEQLNSLGKFLDENQGQEWPLNSTILDVLGNFSDLERPHEPEVQKRNLAAQAGRIRSDFFDAKRRLVQSMTEVILEKAPSPSFGIPPDHIYA